MYKHSWWECRFKNGIGASCRLPTHTIGWCMDAALVRDALIHNISSQGNPWYLQITWYPQMTWYLQIACVHILRMEFGTGAELSLPCSLWRIYVSKQYIHHLPFLIYHIPSTDYQWSCGMFNSNYSHEQKYCMSCISLKEGDTLWLTLRTTASCLLV